MRVIYKYPLEITAEQVINIPMLYFDDRVARCNEQVLHVDVQDVIRPCLWCMCVRMLRIKPEFYKEKML